MFDPISWTQPLYLTGWILAVGVLVSLGITISSARRQARARAKVCRREVEVLDGRIAKIRSARVESDSAAAGWEGFANFFVSKKTPHSESGICSFYLKPNDPRLKLAPFQPGQHLVFQLPIPGESQPLVRRYSLSDSTNGDYYRISVKHQLPPEDRPDLDSGKGSTFLHQQVRDREGSQERCHLYVAPPQGSFHLDPEEDTPVVLIGGGVGVTPMLSMFNAILESNPEREVWF
ncbi:MAG: hypothetical protein AAF585_04720, partial [Verrucomicrobiota bacterium]